MKTTLKSMYFLLPLLLFLLMCSISFFANTCNDEPIFSNTSSSEIRFSKTDVKPGKWSASGIIVTVEKSEIMINFDCADAKIDRSFKTNKSGTFSLIGTFTQKGHGPIRINNLPKPQPAKFTGKVTGKKMTLKVTLTDTDEVVGEYTLERGKESKMHYCR